MPCQCSRRPLVTLRVPCCECHGRCYYGHGQRTSGSACRMRATRQLRRWRSWKTEPPAGKLLGRGPVVMPHDMRTLILSCTPLRGRARRAPDRFQTRPPPPPAARPLPLNDLSPSEWQQTTETVRDLRPSCVANRTTRTRRAPHPPHPQPPRLVMYRGPYVSRVHINRHPETHTYPTSTTEVHSRGRRAPARCAWLPNACSCAFRSTNESALPAPTCTCVAAQRVEEAHRAHFRFEDAGAGEERRRAGFLAPPAASFPCFCSCCRA